MRVFGSIVYVYIPDERKAKLDSKSEKFIFIGYDNNSEGCKLHNPNNKKIVISWDIIFYEKRERDFGSNVDDFKFISIEDDNHTQIKQVEE